MLSEHLGYPSLLLPFLDSIAATGALLPASPENRARLLDVAFYASLHREEGRELAFTLAFITPDAIDAEGHPPFSTLRFDPALDFSVAQVVKLAPALDYRLASIGIGENAGELQIWGLFRHGSAEFEMLEGLEDGAETLGTDHLRITSERPGRLDLDFGLSRVASFASGKIEDGVRLLSNKGPVSDVLVNAGRAQGDNSYLHLVQQVVWTIRSARHGGTLIFLPDSQMNGIRSAKYFAAPQSRAADDLRDRDRDYRRIALEHSDFVQKIAVAAEKGSGIPSHLCHGARTALSRLRRANHTRRESIRFFAALANVDGALVLGPDLRVLAFGAMLETATVADFAVHLATDVNGATERAIPVGALGGARHQSAAHFCHNRVGAVAIVISQDGAVSSVYNDGDKLRAWKGIRLDRRQPRTAS